MSWVTQCSRQCCLGLLVKNVHLILVQAFGTAELQPPLTSTKVQVLLSVANMFAPVTHLVSLKIGSAAGGEALLTAETLQLTSHA